MFIFSTPPHTLVAFLVDRLVNVHGEDPDTDFIHAGRAISNALKSIHDVNMSLQSLWALTQSIPQVRQFIDTVEIKPNFRQYLQPQLMAYAPKDREIFVYCPPMHGLSELISRSKWHPDTGFCVDELRTPVLWWDIPENVTLAYEAAVALDYMSSTETVLTEVYKELERRRNESKSTTDEEAPTLSGEARPKQSTAVSPNIEFELHKVPPRNWELSCQGIVYGAFMERSRAVQIINYCSVILSDLMLKGIMPERRIRHQLETTNGFISDYFFGDDQVMMINPEDPLFGEGSEGS